MAQRRNRRNKQRSEEIDETLIDVVEVKDNVTEYFEENKTMILGGIGLLILLVVAFISYRFAYKAPMEANAFEQMYRAETQFSRDSFALALENPGGGFEGFLDIIDNYPGTNAANLSKYYAGVSYLNLGRYEDAIEYLDSYSPAGDVTPIMKFGAIADAHSELGDYDNAISNYRKAANASDNELLTPYYLNKLALLLKKEGDDEGALSIFKQIKEKYPKSTEGIAVDRYIYSMK